MLILNDPLYQEQHDRIEETLKLSAHSDDEDSCRHYLECFSFEYDDCLALLDGLAESRIETGRFTSIQNWLYDATRPLLRGSASTISDPRELFAEIDRSLHRRVAQLVGSTERSKRANRVVRKISTCSIHDFQNSGLELPQIRKYLNSHRRLLQSIEAGNRENMSQILGDIFCYLL